jgi:hypothetical protein
VSSTGRSSRPLGSVAIAAATSEVASAVGDSVLAPAVLAAVAEQPSGKGTKPVAKTPKVQAPAPIRVTANSATGQFAVAHTNGTFKRPTKIMLKVSSSPSQTASVYWTIVCLEHGGGVGHQDAHATVQLPMSESLPVPASPVYCNASANVQLSKSGSVTISLTG